MRLLISQSDLPRIQVFSVLVAYEIFHLQQRMTMPSQLSAELGHVFCSAREEMGLKRTDLVKRAGMSRIAFEVGGRRPATLSRAFAALGYRVGFVGRRSTYNYQGRGRHTAAC